MKRKIRNITASLLGFLLIGTGSIRKAKKKIKDNNYITGVYFHNPSKKLFEKCITWLIKNGFNIISSRELEDILSKKMAAPDYAVWISLDDGWKDNMSNVFPFAVKNKIPLTFFITTEAVEGSGVYWWSLAESNKELLQEPYKSDINKLWKVSENERKNIIKGLVTKTNAGFKREAMTIEDVKQISNCDFITIGSHTVNHVITPNCTDEELNYELGESKRKLEEWTQKEVNFFCYPNGDLSGKEEAILINNGYRMAAAAENEFITVDAAHYKIPRFSIGEGYFYEELCHMFGVWQKVVKKFKY